MYRAGPDETLNQATKRRFDELRDKEDADGAEDSSKALLDVLRDRPEHETLEILRRLRAGVSADALLQRVQHADLLLQVTLEPETCRRYQFPLVAGMPPFLLTADNPYLQSIMYQATSGGDETGRSRRSGDAEPSAAVKAIQWQSPYMKPYAAARLVEPLLDKVTAAKWTPIITDNVLFRRLLEAYFLYSHPHYTLFHKNLFLEDMASGKTDYCSTSLVNAVLTTACVSWSRINVGRFLHG